MSAGAGSSHSISAEATGLDTSKFDLSDLNRALPLFYTIAKVMEPIEEDVAN